LGIFSKAFFSAAGAVKRLTGRVAPTLYMEETEKHFADMFGFDCEKTRVFHELMSDIVHIDVHIVPPDEGRPFYLLFTTGMSDLPMTLPEDFGWDRRKICERAEIYCLLPPDWKFEGFGSNEEKARYLWIISVLKQSARYPHICKTALGSMHSLQFTEDNTPFADNTKFSSAVFLHSDSRDFNGKYGDGLGYFRTEDGAYINLLCFIPMYEDEMRFKLEKGGDELFLRLFGETVTDLSQLIININRENICLNKFI
jgi:hypothetical protein